MIEPKSRVFRILPPIVITKTLSFFDRVSLIFVKLHVHPNTLTFLGFFAGAAVGLFYFLDRPLWALVFILICGFCDILDGKVAVNSGRKSLFGAILDSSFDRYSEFFMYTGLAWHFRRHWAIWIIFVAFLGSTMVSYTRARAEGLGIDCRVGMMQRAERLVFLFAGTFIGLVFRVFNPAMIVAMTFIAVASNATTFQRLYYVWEYEHHPTSPTPRT